MPLEVTDPKDEFGDGGGAGVELDAEELMGIDGVGFEFQFHVLAKLRGGVQHFSLKDFEMLQSDVEEITAAAGGIEHADCAQLFVEVEDFLLGLAHVGIGGLSLIERGFVVCLGTFEVSSLGLEGGALFQGHCGGCVLHRTAGMGDGGGADVFPLLAQGLDDGGEDEALHVGARGEVCAEGVAL